MPVKKLAFKMQPTDKVFRCPCGECEIGRKAALERLAARGEKPLNRKTDEHMEKIRAGRKRATEKFKEE